MSLKTDWVCLDCELMPWSAKAQELLRRNMRRSELRRASAGLDVGNRRAGCKRSRTIESRGLGNDFRAVETAKPYVDAYRRYCWPVQSLPDLKLAPFHLLASEGKRAHE